MPISRIDHAKSMVYGPRRPRMLIFLCFSMAKISCRSGQFDVSLLDTRAGLNQMTGNLDKNSSFCPPEECLIEKMTVSPASAQTLANRDLSFSEAPLEAAGRPGRPEPIEGRSQVPAPLVSCRRASCK